MPSLPSATEVRGLIGTSLTDTQIESLIQDAALMVERCVRELECARARAIIKYMTAHLVTVAESRERGAIVAQSLGDASESYAAPMAGEDLRSSPFGQAAIALDPNGCLNRIGKPRATLRVV